MSIDSPDSPTPVGPSLRMAATVGLLGSAIVILSQLVDGFSMQDMNGIEIPNSASTLLDKHGPMVIVLAALAAFSLVYTLLMSIRGTDGLAARYLATGLVLVSVGLAVVIIFLIVDLPDVGTTGMATAPGVGAIDATGVAEPGLWMELVGGLILMLGGTALVVGTRDH